MPVCQEISSLQVAWWNFLCLPHMPIMCFAKADMIGLSVQWLGVRLEYPGFESRQRYEILLSFEASILALERIQPPVQLALDTQELKWQGHDADALASTSAKCSIPSTCAQHAKGKHHFTAQKIRCIPSERPISCLFWQLIRNVQTQCVIRMIRMWKIWVLKQY